MQIHQTRAVSLSGDAKRWYFILLCHLMRAPTEKRKGDEQRACRSYDEFVPVYQLYESRKVAMLIFEQGWDSDNNNNSPNALSKDRLESAIIDAVKQLKQKTNDDEFIILVAAVLSPDKWLTSYVSKGMHQETGNSILPETHCTLDVPEFPRRRKYHIWYTWARAGKGKKGGWFASKVTYEFEKGRFREVLLW